MKLAGQADRSALEAIRERSDFTLAADMIRNGETIVIEELREILASKLEGKFKGTRGPRKNADTRIKRMAAQRFYDSYMLRNPGSSDAAALEAANRFNVSPRTIYKWLQHDGDDVQSAVERLARTLRKLNLFPRK